MVTLTYNGPAGRRIISKEDGGLSADVDVARGEAFSVSKKDAERLAEIGEFVEVTDSAAAGATDPTGSDDATSPNEGS